MLQNNDEIVEQPNDELDSEFDELDSEFDESFLDIDENVEFSEQTSESDYIISTQAPMSFAIDACVEVNEELSDPENYYGSKFIYERVVGYLKDISSKHEKYAYIRDLSIEFIESGSSVLYLNELYEVQYVFNDNTVLIHNHGKDSIKLIDRNDLLPNDNSCKNITNKDVKFLFDELISRFSVDKDTIYDVFVSFSNYMKIDVKKIFKSLDDKTQNKIVLALNKRT